ncbi:putative transcriptional regulator [Bifidobacterium saguini DSM 23967]|uniref:DNA binding domain-containing protein n=2 Tax=Bifidobacterium saguini TaxID=762210 RepID=A0ABX7SA03_9BIFI|nr:ATP-binding protein [Bifidobacterium saguini]KFI91555.1 putative transcriptional regulator [Bifidobacterium saguini DSM 23967]QTB90229.1 putative DNA binding domain-containing protein [Bifidobacterium saguini]
MPEDIIALITALARQDSENECLEFKHSNTDPNRIGRDISALANSAALLGHTFAYKVWGIDDVTHELIGTAFNPKTTKVGNQELELWLRQHLSDNVEFRFESAEAFGKHLILLRIWPAQYRPVLWQGLAYIRTGSSTQELKHGSKREEELWSRTRAEFFELQYALSGLTDDEVLNKLDTDWYRQEFGIPQTTSIEQTMHLLESEQFVFPQDSGTYAITNLGALLFARNLNDFPTVSRKALRVIRYDGSSPIAPSRSKTFNSGYAQLDQMLEYIEALLPEQEIIQGARRVTLRAFPHTALRELTANMLIHQDLSITGAGPMVCIFDNRIEFTNPGRSLVNVARLLNDPPHSRNEKMAAICRRLQLCEEAGSGWDKVVLDCEQHHLPAPQVEEPGDNMRVTLMQATPYRELTREQRMDAAYWHACVQYAQRIPMTNTSLRERFALPQSGTSQISRLIKTCLDDHLLKIADPDAGKRYIRYLPYWA